MATTDTIFVLTPQGSTAPSANFATPDTVAETSTPNSFFPVLDFDASTDEFIDWHRTVPSHYGGGGFTVSWKGGTDNTSVADLTLEISMVVVSDAAVMTGDEGLDTATPVIITDTPPSTPQNKFNYSSTGTLTHANAGSPSVGDYMIIRAQRDAADGNTGDLQLAEILILET